MKKIDEIIQMVREDMTVANLPGQSGNFGENSPRPNVTGGYSQLMFGLRRNISGKLDKRNPFIQKYKVILQSQGLA